jgi:transcriptional regulator GlxA family with amidase domain
MRCSILLFDGFTALDVVGGYEVLVNVPGMELEFVAESPGLIAADSGRLGLCAYRGFDEVAATDILYVPGGPGVEAALDNPALLAWLQRVQPHSQYTLSICNGAELLGGAGLLVGRQVCTNWFARERVAAYGALVQTGRYHKDGSIISGAGVSASIDTALFLTGLLAGEEMAKVIQFGIEYYPDPPFGNGSPDQQPESAKALIRAFEQAGAQRLAARKIPFARHIELAPA